MTTKQIQKNMDILDLGGEQLPPLGPPIPTPEKGAEIKITPPSPRSFPPLPQPAPKPAPRPVPVPTPQPQPGGQPLAQPPPPPRPPPTGGGQQSPPSGGGGTTQPATSWRKWLGENWKMIGWFLLLVVSLLMAARATSRFGPGIRKVVGSLLSSTPATTTPSSSGVSSTPITPPPTTAPSAGVGPGPMLPLPTPLSAPVTDTNVVLNPPAVVKGGQPQQPNISTVINGNVDVKIENLNLALSLGGGQASATSSKWTDAKPDAIVPMLDDDAGTKIVPPGKDYIFIRPKGFWVDSNIPTGKDGVNYLLAKNSGTRAVPVWHKAMDYREDAGELRVLNLSETDPITLYFVFVPIPKHQTRQ